MYMYAVVKIPTKTGKVYGPTLYFPCLRAHNMYGIEQLCVHITVLYAYPWIFRTWDVYSKHSSYTYQVKPGNS